MEGGGLRGPSEALLSSRETQTGSREEKQGLGYSGPALASEENKRDKGIS